MIRSVLICHHDEPLNRFGLARWLASFTECAAVVVIREPRGRLLRRIRTEIRRIGWFRFLDVLAFRLYYRMRWAAVDRAWEASALQQLTARYPDLPADCRIVETESPNHPAILELMASIQPDFILARCKSILTPAVFNSAAQGTFVMHPGICPEYRNAHGCFWALANRDLQKVGMTLLRVNAGVDTGPVYGYYTYAYDEKEESHIVIQERVVLENLDRLRTDLEVVLGNPEKTIDTSNRSSKAWGQPWLTAYLRWKRLARKS